MSYVIYLYDSYDFKRNSNKLGYFISYNQDSLNCVGTIDSGAFVFKRKSKAESIAYDCLRLDGVCGFDIEDDNGSLIKSQRLSADIDKDIFCLFNQLNSFEKSKFLKNLKDLQSQRVCVSDNSNVGLLTEDEYKLINDFKREHNIKLVPKILRMCIGKNSSQLEEIANLLERKD